MDNCIPVIDKLLSIRFDEGVRNPEICKTKLSEFGIGTLE